MSSSEAIVHPGPEPGGLWSVLLFVRFSGIGFSLSLPLLGAGTVVQSVPAGTLAALCLVAACFHVYVFVLNDVIDLEVDRTEPRRAGFPLVRGKVTPAQALAVALVQVPVSFAVALGHGVQQRGLLALSAAYGLGLIYNLWGKRTGVPLLTDAAQSLAWASLVWFGAVAAGGEPAPTTWIVGGYVALYVLMINGVHGGLRDLRNDIACGVRSTAIRLGAYIDAAGRARFSPTLRAYAIGLQVAMLVLALVAIVAQVREHGPTAGVPAAAVALTSGAAAVALLWLGATAVDAGVDAGSAGLLQMVAALIPVMAVVFAGTGLALSATIAAVFATPLLTHSLTYRSARWTVRMLRGAWGR